MKQPKIISVSECHISNFCTFTVDTNSSTTKRQGIRAGCIQVGGGA